MAETYIVQDQDRRESQDVDYKYDVFIGHSSADKDFVKEILQKLTKLNIRCYTDDDFIPGKPVVQNIIHGIEISKKTLLVISNAFLESGWCVYETYITVDKNNRLNKQCLIPLVYDVQEEKIPHWLRMINFVDRKNIDYLDKLIKAVNQPNAPLMLCLSNETNPQELINCPNYNCGFRCHKDDKEMQTHERRCRFLTVQCQYANNCKRTFQLKDVNKKTEHEQECCYSAMNCDMCDEQILKMDLESHRQSCELSEMSCTNESCSHKFPKSGLKYHKSTCEFEMIKCQNSGCNEMIERKDYLAHATATCQYQALKCQNGKPPTTKKPQMKIHKDWIPGCTSTFQRRDMVGHRDMCDFRLVDCPNKGCLSLLHSNEVSTHLLECPLKVISCPNVPCCYQFYISDEADIKKHTATCEFRFKVIKCKNAPCCYQFYKQDTEAIQDHATNCQFKKIPCVNKKFGCDHVFDRTQSGKKTKKSHEPQCDYSIVECINTLCQFKHRRFEAASDENCCGFLISDCPNKESGCSSVMFKRDIKEHKKSCPFKSTKCKTCGEAVKIKELKEQTHRCPARLVLCTNNGCKQSYKITEEETHHNQCQYELIPCSNIDCEWQLLRRDVKNHKQDICDYEIISCVFSHHGCTHTSPRINMRDHERTCDRHVIDMKY